MNSKQNDPRPVSASRGSQKLLMNSLADPSDIIKPDPSVLSRGGNEHHPKSFASMATPPKYQYGGVGISNPSHE